MAKVRLLQGKPLMVGGKVSLSDDCCCGGACPDVETLNVEFAGVLLDCACVDIPENSSSVIVTDISFNGPFALSGGTGIWTGNGGVIHAKTFAGSSCGGSPTFDGDAQVSIQVTCDTGKFVVFCWVGAVALYYSPASSTLASRPNQLTCGSVAPTIIGGVFRGVSHDGTATIST
jgi:hypothetical protein